MERDSEIITSFGSVWPWLTLCLILGLFVSGLIEHKRNKTWLIWFGSLWFFGMLAPTSGIIPINGLIYEHWLYLPIVGFGIVVFGFLRLLKIPDKLKQLHPSLVNWCLIVIFGVNALLTLRQNYLWRAPIPFYEYTLQYANSARLHNNLAMAYDTAGQTQKAIAEYQAALEISNAYPQVYHNLARAYIQVNELEKAEQSYLAALQLDPTFSYSQSDLLQLYLFQERYSDALPLVNALNHAYPNDTQLNQLKQKIINKMKSTP